MTSPVPSSSDGVVVVPGTDGEPARIQVRRAREGELALAYPAGTHDRELVVEGSPSPAAVAGLAAAILAADERCRRVVLPVPEQDLPAIAWAEEAGFRYVVDVETRAGSFSLLVVEPGWVLEQPHVLADIPLKE